MIQTIGIYHIGIPVDDLDRAEGFYTRVLGMKVERESVSQERGSSASNAAAGAGRYGAILWVEPRDVNKAAKVLLSGGS